MKNAWGFCDGTTVYVYHQKEFFPIEIHDENLKFYGYKDLNQKSHAGGEIMMGGASCITEPCGIIVALPIIFIGGIVAASTSSSYKKHKVEYSISPVSGRIERVLKTTANSKNIKYTPPKTKPIVSGQKSINKNDQMTELILYRNNKKELDSPLKFSVNDSVLVDNFLPNSFVKLPIDAQKELITICYGENYEECIKLASPISNSIYAEFSMSKKDHNLRVTEVNTENGEFYSNKAKYFQDRR